MMKKEFIKPKIIYVSDGKAFYPSMLANARILRSMGFQVEELRRGELAEAEDISNAILWIMMGFYPRALSVNCMATIHEYRSQSTGSYRGIRDVLKRYLNHKPSYRLYQSLRIKKAFDPGDGVDWGILPLGVSKDILMHRDMELACDYDFCYIGAISEERDISKMLDGFLLAYSAEQSIVLVGEVRDGLAEKYSCHSNIKFAGRVSQEEAFNYVNRSSFSVCYFPAHPPHCYQPPTKLYEYAALGRRILANDSPANVEEIARLGIKAHVMRGNKFPQLSELDDVLDNSDFDPSPLFFEESIRSSGVIDFIANVSRGLKEGGRGAIYD
jgi:glycosyltransferase involved in cell wall biosynthesis